MLKSCPECELLVSEKAITCPHCGYPLKSENAVIRHKNKAKRRRLPNGFGQITELKGRNLRKPFRVMVTVAKDDAGRPICKLLKPEAYFATYNEAYIALLEYNRNPFDVTETITLRELYTRWFPEGTKHLQKVSIRNITAAWQYCVPLYDMNVRAIKARDVKLLLEKPSKEIEGVIKYASASSISRMKSLLNMLFDYAKSLELIDRNFVKEIRLSHEIVQKNMVTVTEHIVFENNEILKLWDAANKNDIAKMVLIQCYMGWRPQELTSLKVKAVDVSNWTITGGMKTAAGANRIVPIHSSIRPLVCYWLEKAKNNGSDWLFSKTNDKTKCLTYSQYSYRFHLLIIELSLNPAHRAHDPRKQFVSMAKKYDVNEYALKRFVGHKISDITEAVYTTRDAAWYRNEIEKIKTDCSSCVHE